VARSFLNRLIGRVMEAIVIRPDGRRGRGRRDPRAAPSTGRAPAPGRPSRLHLVGLSTGGPLARLVLLSANPLFHRHQASLSKVTAIRGPSRQQSLINGQIKFSNTTGLGPRLLAREVGSPHAHDAAGHGGRLGSFLQRIRTASTATPPRTGPGSRARHRRLLRATIAATGSGLVLTAPGRSSGRGGAAMGTPTIPSAGHLDWRSGTRAPRRREGRSRQSRPRPGLSPGGACCSGATG
jgi:hypothetical protein